jgi:hypothetical protein
MKSKIKCLLCGSICFQFKVISHRYKAYKCSGCLFEFVEPMPGNNELRAYYSNYSNFRAEDTVLLKNSLRNIRYLYKFGLSKKKNLLDFGCGKNMFIAERSSGNWFGFDKYSNVSSGNLIKDYRSRSWEFITLWGVLEHLVDPIKTLHELSANLEPRGKLALTTVTTESEIPIRYKPPEHVTFWNKKSIELLFDRVNLQMIDFRNYTMIQRSDIYLECVLRTVPGNYKKKIINQLPEYVEVPTNEIFVVGEKL